jgi:hypothetical protein
VYKYQRSWEIAKFACKIYYNNVLSTHVFVWWGWSLPIGRKSFCQPKKSVLNMNCAGDFEASRCRCILTFTPHSLVTSQIFGKQIDKSVQKSQGFLAQPSLAYLNCMKGAYKSPESGLCVYFYCIIRLLHLCMLLCQDAQNHVLNSSVRA